MTLPIITTEQIAICFGTIGLAAGGFERWQASRKKIRSEQEEMLLSDAKMHKERAETFKQMADESMKFFVDEREAHEKTREFHHAKATEAQNALLRCQESIAEYKMRPDLTEVMEFIKQQSVTSVEILGGIKAIITRLEQTTHHK